MPVSIQHSLAEGVDRNEPGVASALLDLLTHRPAFHADAACVEHPELTWFPPRGADLGPVKAVCASCLVLAECRTWALAQGPQLAGVWGGLSDRERRLRRRPAA